MVPKIHKITLLQLCSCHSFHQQKVSSQTAVVVVVGSPPLVLQYVQSRKVDDLDSDLAIYAHVVVVSAVVHMPVFRQF